MKQIDLTTKEIRENLKYLQSKLPTPPTPHHKMFELPKGLAVKIQSSNYSQQSIQELADLIGFYLGLLRSIKVKIGVESSSDMLMGGKDWDRLDRAGLYKVWGYDVGLQPRVDT